MYEALRSKGMIYETEHLDITISLSSHDLCQCGAVKHDGTFYKHADGCNESRIEVRCGFTF